MPIYLGSQPIGEVNVSFTSPDGGTNTNDATLSEAAQLLEGVTAYSKGKKYQGTIPTKTESNLTAIDNIVNVPAGYYASACSKEIATIDFPEKEMVIDDSGLISCVSNLTTGGFLSAGQKTTTLQLPVESGKIITPSSIEQTAVAAHKYTTGAVKVAAVPTETKKVTANGTYTPSSGKYFSSVEVVIAGNAPVYQDKTVNPTTSLQTILPDDGYDALSQVKVNAISVEQKSATPKATMQDIIPSSGSYLSKVTVGAVPTETKTISTNGTYSPTSGKFFSAVTVNVPTGSAAPALQEKTIAPIETAQEIIPDAGYDGLSKVSVEAIATDYIGSGVIRVNEIPEEDWGGFSSWNQAMAFTLLVTDATPFDSALCIEAGAVPSALTEADQKILLTALGHDEITFSNSLTDEEQAAIFTNPATGATPACNLLMALLEGKFKQAILIEKEYKASISDDEKSFFAAQFLGSNYQTWQTAENIVYINGEGINDRNLAMLEFAIYGYTGGTVEKDRLAKGLWFDPKVDMSPMSTDERKKYLGTATVDQVLSGVTFTNASGFAQTGTLVIQKYYTGVSAPSASLGNDGDIYFVTQ